MEHLTDEQVMQGMRQKREDARTAQKEGPGTPRGPGMAGRIAAEWMRWRNEAIKRGLA